MNDLNSTTKAWLGFFTRKNRMTYIIEGSLFDGWYLTGVTHYGGLLDREYTLYLTEFGQVVGEQRVTSRVTSLTERKLFQFKDLKDLSEFCPDAAMAANLKARLLAILSTAFLESINKTLGLIPEEGEND